MKEVLQDLMGNIAKILGMAVSFGIFFGVTILVAKLIAYL